MSAHIHAALMTEYAKDALETDKPWERWEWQMTRDRAWCPCRESPNWHSAHEYRRKSTPLCQIEGRDVFPGDKLWWKARNKWVIVGGKFANSDSHLRVGSHDSAWPDELTWTEPAKTKTVYQWAILWPNESKWFVSDWLFSTEQEVREQVVVKGVRRLDWTALEVPA